MKEILIALVDDWELRGTGAGNVIENQVKPMASLMTLYEKYSIRGTFNVEVMQQLYMRKFQLMFPELKTQADAWDMAVVDALRRGHDIQLHIHPQWLNASYCTERGWQLDSNWDITKYDQRDVEDMFKDSIAYLNSLFRRNDIEHRLCSYRAGSWAFAPSDFMLDILEKNNLILDMSLVKGLKYDTDHVKLDYTVMEEDILPYYPVYTDARLVSNKKENVVCIPTFGYKWILRESIKEIIDSKKRVKKAENIISSVNWSDYKEWEKKKSSNAWGGVLNKFNTLRDLTKPMVADLACMSRGRMKSLVRSIDVASKKCTHPVLPVVLENHTKDIISLDNIEYFISECISNPNIHFITITELVQMIEDNKVEVMMKDV